MKEPALSYRLMPRASAWKQLSVVVISVLGVLYLLSEIASAAAVWVGANVMTKPGQAEGWLDHQLIELVNFSMHITGWTG